MVVVSQGQEYGKRRRRVPLMPFLQLGEKRKGAMVCERRLEGAGSVSSTVLEASVVEVVDATKQCGKC